MNLQKMLTDALQDDLVEIREYSGRGMYGKSCLAITGASGDCKSTLQRVVARALELAYENGYSHCDGDIEYPDLEMYEVIELVDIQKICENLLDYSQDSMGYDSVIYWPKIPFIEEG